MTTTCWTCSTSFVLRVMSDGVPKWFTSTWENVWTCRKTALRTSRPKAIATFAPQYVPMTDAPPNTSVMRIIRPPVRQMKLRSPFTTPLLMISAFSSGRYMLAIAWTKSRAITRARGLRYGPR